MPEREWRPSSKGNDDKDDDEACDPTRTRRRIREREKKRERIDSEKNTDGEWCNTKNTLARTQWMVAQGFLHSLSHSLSLFHSPSLSLFRRVVGCLFLPHSGTASIPRRHSRAGVNILARVVCSFFRLETIFFLFESSLSPKP